MPDLRLRSRLPVSALGAAIALITVAIFAASRCIERLHTAYLFAHGRIPTDDLTQGYVNVRLAAWGMVLCLAVVASILLRYWHRAKRQMAYSGVNYTLNKHPVQKQTWASSWKPGSPSRSSRRGGLGSAASSQTSNQEVVRNSSASLRASILSLLWPNLSKALSGVSRTSRQF
jgi:hypothetical protein